MSTTGGRVGGPDGYPHVGGLVGTRASMQVMPSIVYDGAGQDWHRNIPGLGATPWKHGSHSVDARLRLKVPAAHCTHIPEVQ